MVVNVIKDKVHHGLVWGGLFPSIIFRAANSVVALCARAAENTPVHFSMPSVAKK
jgi:hypothetical protein